MDSYLHEWHIDLCQGQRQVTATDTSSSGKTQKEWPFLKPWQMCFQYWKSQIPGNNHQGEPDSNGANWKAAGFGGLIEVD